MIFDRLSLDQALGCFLVHSLKVGGQRFKKGRILTQSDLAALAEAGIEQVLAAKLEADDIPEDAAAEQIARAAQGDNARLQPAFTGRANLYAECDGLAVIDRARVDQLNGVDEAITIATVPPYAMVREGQMLATVKIIPFAARDDDVNTTVTIAAGPEPLVRVAAIGAKSIVLIMTQLPETKAKVLDKTEQVLRQRLEDLGSNIKESHRCGHDREAIQALLQQILAGDCDMVMIFGASAITDRRDEVPAAIVAAGGEIEHFGMPVDPGNLLLLAARNGRPIIGLPGCARSPKLNGFDWVLQRLCAGLAIGRHDIMGLGAGGLLKEIPSRPQPRHDERAASDGDVPRAARIAALILAAGQSRRMGAENKLLAEVAGRAMVNHAVAAAAQSNCRSTTVVIGHQADDLRQALAGADLSIVENPDFAAGLSTSLKTGLAALPADIDGVIILLGDMPEISAQHIDRLIAAFNPLEGRAICVPTVDGKRGNPVLFAQSLVPEMRDAAGDIGAKHVIGANEDAIAEVAMDDTAALLDIDTPAALAAFRAKG